jgi:hypothetical protein
LSLPKSSKSVRYLIFVTLVLSCLSRTLPISGQDSKSQFSDEISANQEHVDFNRNIYFKHKLEFSLDTGWFPDNIPFIFDPLTGDPWGTTPLKYTLVPIIFSLRWHWGNIAAPSFIRGNTDLTFSGSYTVIPRGPEHLYAAFMFGVRRNFVQPNWRIVPYVELRGGAGYTDAKGPDGVPWAQGQDFTFNFIMGGGVRYNFTPRYGISAGIGYLHISNLYLSEPKVPNYGINVFGPTFGVNIGLGKLR